MIRNLHSLETLELENCSINELPKEIKELKKLRLLGLINCEIQRNNPFKVIETCSKLEELYFVKNDNIKDWMLQDDKEIKDEIAHDISPLALQMYSIACDGFRYFDDEDNGFLKCFNAEYAKSLISNAMIKYLMGRAEILELGNIEEKGWKSLIPDIIDERMHDLIKLCLYEWEEIECLIDASKHNSHATESSNLVQLYLIGVGVKELYKSGLMPSSFLSKLQILKLERCKKLHNIFFDVNFKVPHLKVLELSNCPMF